MNKQQQQKKKKKPAAGTSQHEILNTGGELKSYPCVVPIFGFLTDKSKLKTVKYGPCLSSEIMFINLSLILQQSREGAGKKI